MFQKLFITTLIFSTLALPSFAQKNILAKVGNKNITVEEFEAKFNELVKAAVNPPTRDQFLEEYVRYQIGLQEASRLKLQDDPIVRDQMQQAMYKGLLEKSLSKKADAITISTEEMMKYYKTNPDIRSSHILIEVKQAATEAQKMEAKKRATEIFEDVKKSKRPFNELVRLYSDDFTTKEQGGDVGFQNRATLLPHIYEALLEMKDGEIRGLFLSQVGYHIVKKMDTRSFEKANRKVIRTLVFDQKRKALLDDFFANLKKNYPVEINKNLLK